jgi:hypothetical protein
MISVNMYECKYGCINDCFYRKQRNKFSMENASAGWMCVWVYVDGYMNIILQCKQTKMRIKQEIFYNLLFYDAKHENPFRGIGKLREMCFDFLFCMRRYYLKGIRASVKNEIHVMIFMSCRLTSFLRFFGVHLNVFALNCGEAWKSPERIVEIFTNCISP